MANLTEFSLSEVSPALSLPFPRFCEAGMELPGWTGKPRPNSHLAPQLEPLGQAERPAVAVSPHSGHLRPDGTDRLSFPTAPRERGNRFVLALVFSFVYLFGGHNQWCLVVSPSSAFRN